jgi:hypothetical protein
MLWIKDFSVLHDFFGKRNGLGGGMSKKMSLLGRDTRIHISLDYYNGSIQFLLQLSS